MNHRVGSPHALRTSRSVRRAARGLLRTTAACAIGLSSLPLSLLAPPSIVRAEETWAGQTSTTTSDLYGVAAIDAQTAWAVGGAGAVRRTIDGGATWTTPTLTPASTALLLGVDQGTASTGWLVGWEASIYKTTDSGATWTAQTNPLTGLTDANARMLNAVDAVDASTAWAVGQGGVVLTTINGTDWTQAATNPTTQRMEGVAALSATTAWVGDEAGNILKTIDGGATWSTQVQFC